MIGLTIFKSIYTIKHRNIVFCFASVLVVGLNLNVKYVCVPGWEFVISIVNRMAPPFKVFVFKEKR